MYSTLDFSFLEFQAYYDCNSTMTTDQGFFIEPIGVTKCLNYLYYITSPIQGYTCIMEKIPVGELYT